MKIFSYLFEKVIVWSAAPRARYYLFAVSVAESIFFPVPVDAMLAPMVLVNKEARYQLALIATVGSVVGGVIGYLLGCFAFDWVSTFIIEGLGKEAAFATIQDWLARWGFWVVFLAGFSPLPYKIFTVGSGAFGIAFVPFVLASCLSRAARFYLVALLISLGGRNIEHFLKRHIDRLGWAMVAVVVVYISFAR